jgi:hypothetical protein
MDIPQVIGGTARGWAGASAAPADFVTGVESVIAITDPATSKFVYPAAVVIALEDETGSNDRLDGNIENVTDTVRVAVEFDASADRRGRAGVSQVEAMKCAPFGALLSWVMDAGGRH